MPGSVAVLLERAGLLLPSCLVAPPALGKAGGSGRGREAFPLLPPGVGSGFPSGYAVASQLNAALQLLQVFSAFWFPLGKPELVKTYQRLSA